MSTEFKPTWLYIKKHNDTGLQYFGKTTRKDPIKYYGSGNRWLNHLKSHGFNISTTWCQLFLTKDALVEYAINFSKENKIVESNQWANLKAENGLDGGGRLAGQYKHSELTKEKIKLARAKQITLRTGQSHSIDTINKIKAKRALQITSVETKAKISKALTGNKNNKFSKGASQ